MVKIGKKIVKFRAPIFILCMLLLFPAGWGYLNTRVNYDILSYLPDSLETVKGHDGVLPVLPMKDAVYYSEDGKQVSLLERERIFAGQAPEAFRLGPYLKANERLLPKRILGVKGSTEPAVLAGLDVVMIPGDERNFKITTREDLERFRQLRI